MMSRENYHWLALILRHGDEKEPPNILLSAVKPKQGEWSPVSILDITRQIVGIVAMFQNAPAKVV